jgi:hypothetical protein
MRALRRRAAVNGLSGCAGILAAVVLCSAGARAAANPSNECKVLLARVTQAVGRSFDARDQVKNTFRFHLARGGEIEVRCLSPAHKSAVIFMRSDNEYPPRSFYAILSKVGASVSGRSAKDVNKWAHRCHRVARRTADGRAQKGRHSLNIECRRSEARSVFFIKGPFYYGS